MRTQGLPVLALLALAAACSGSGGSPGSGTGGGGGTTHGWLAGVDIGLARDAAAVDIYDVDVDVNGSTVAVAAWEEDDGDTAGSVWVAWRRSGAWEAPARLSDVAARAVHPRVALNDAGQAVVAFEVVEHSGPAIVSRTVWARRYVGGAWLAAERLCDAPAAPNALYAWRPRVGIDGDGNALVAWDQIRDEAPSTIQASRFDGTAWSAPSPVSVGTTAASWSDVAVSAGGRAAVVWTQDTNPWDPNRPGGGPVNPSVRARVLSGAGWADPQVLSTTLADFEGTERPRVVMDAAGRAFAIWEEHRAGNAVVAATLDAAAVTTWSALAVLASSASPTEHLSFPAIAAGGGGAVAAWLRDVPGTGDVAAAAARLDPGTGTWAALLDFEAGGVGAVAVAMDGGGAGWLLSSSTTGTIRARRLPPTGPIEAASAVGAGTVHDAQANAAGTLVVGSHRSWFDAAAPAFLRAAGAAVYLP